MIWLPCADTVKAPPIMGSEGESLMRSELCSGRNTCVHCASPLGVFPRLFSSSNEEEAGI